MADDLPEITAAMVRDAIEFELNGNLCHAIAAALRSDDSDVEVLLKLKPSSKQFANGCRVAIDWEIDPAYGIL